MIPLQLPTFSSLLVSCLLLYSPPAHLVLHLSLYPPAARSRVDQRANPPRAFKGDEINVWNDRVPNFLSLWFPTRSDGKASRQTLCCASQTPDLQTYPTFETAHISTVSPNSLQSGTITPGTYLEETICVRGG